MTETIFALSSGAPPAAIAVIRISGPYAANALSALSGRVTSPRKASHLTLRNAQGEILDRVLGLWLPGPGTATGEDTVELHCHGGRAVVVAIEAALAEMPELRRATPGEFTRRAFANGKIDLAEAEGLAELLTAETDLQRRSALAMAGGALSQEVERWRNALLVAGAQVEAVLDFSDDDDVTALPATFAGEIDVMRNEIAGWLQRPRAEALREGFRVVLAGPPNSGKSTLFNALVETEAAITAPIAGTTRDVLTRPVAISGVPFLFVDTAGLREATDDPIEAIGVRRAADEISTADLVLWLGKEGAAAVKAWEIETRLDCPDREIKCTPRHRISAMSGEGLAELREDLILAARIALPRPGEAVLNERQYRLLHEAETMLTAATQLTDPLLIAEHLRLGRLAFDSLVGRATTEDMLDALFSQFCIGK
jgi:tRNA modification GTPase